jgi:hypothetical protein
MPPHAVGAHDRGNSMASTPPDAGLSEALRAHCSQLVETMYSDFSRAGFPDAAQSLFDAIGETEELVDHYARRGLDGSDLLDAVAELSGRLADEEEDEEPESLARTRSAIRAALGRLEQAIDPEAKGRRCFYVYVHKDAQGGIFYVGKGTRGRAWSRDRHSLWHKYVEETLGGKYEVEVVHQGLLEVEAAAIEDELIEEHGERLVNWVNSRRGFDYPTIS